MSWLVGSKRTEAQKTLAFLFVLPVSLRQQTAQFDELLTK
jgi:hypothetical protein